MKKSNALPATCLPGISLRIRQLLFTLLVLLAALSGRSQLYIASGGGLYLNGSSLLTLQNTSLENHGTFQSGTSRVLFSGGQTAALSGSSSLNFYQVDINKPAGQLALQRNISIANQLQFQAGLLDLNGYVLDLGTTGSLQNETESARITGATGGYVQAEQVLNAPNQANPGNLGAQISSASNLGTVILRRGHRVQSGTGLATSIRRYFDISPAINSNLNATLRFSYFEAELNGLSEAALSFYRSADGISWTGPLTASVNTPSNFAEITGVASFSSWTLSAGGALPVTGLDFQARRDNPQTVRLDWKTIQEFNNLGFYVQRRRDHEPDFRDVAFVPSAAPGGNSLFPLFYNLFDNNAYTGTSFYRLRQQDIDGRNSFSPVRSVKAADASGPSLRVWPVPARAVVNVLYTGTAGNDQLQVLDMTGRLVQNHSLQAGTTLLIKGLSPGSYIVRPATNPQLSQRIIIQ